MIAIENVRLFNETKEALGRQTATAEVLRVLGGSMTETQPVFDAIVLNCGNLLDGSRVVLFLVESGQLRARASNGGLPADPLEIDQQSPIGACVAEARLIHLPDLAKAAAQYPLLHRLGLGSGFHSGIYAPLLRNGAAIGGLAVLRRASGAFGDKDVSLLGTFADQAVIAIENVRLFNETTQALEQQTATAEILRVISGSVTDAQPVFDAIVRSCRRLFAGKAVAVVMPRGEMIESVAYASDNPDDDADNILKPWPLDRGSGAGTCILESRLVSVADTVESAKQFARMPQLATALGYRSCLFVPLLRDGRAIGCLTILRATTGAFDAQELALAQTFADQAVIAIENTRLFNETQEALARQTATSDVLQVISESPTDVQPVFEAIVQSGVRLFEGASVAVSMPRDGQVHLMAIAEGAAGRADKWRALFPFPLERDYVHAAALLDCRVIDVPDALDPSGEFARGKRHFSESGYRAMTVVPMVRGTTAIGAISVVRLAPGALADKQLALLQTFADQAVIAIENTRLFNETQEALHALEQRTNELSESLEYQTAISGVLRVISQSSTDVAPVFAAILECATRLFGSAVAAVYRYDGRHVDLAATRNWTPEAIAVARAMYPAPPDGALLAGRVILTGRAHSLDDALSDPAYSRAFARAGYWRRIVGAPMLKDGVPVGAILIAWSEAGSTPPRQLELLQTFADQAVIAIENARLFNETQEALERQTATSEVLQVISASPTDVQPVLEVLAERAGRLCGAEVSRVWLLSGEELRAMTSYGAAFGPDTAGQVLPVRSRSVVGRAAREGRSVHVEDIVPLLDSDYPDVRELQARFGIRSMLAVPMLQEGRSIGVITLMRFQVKPFAPAEIALMQTFADQAVIAIQNTRLFNETQEALARQTATSEVLQVISESPTDVQPVFDIIAERAAALTAARFCLVTRVVGEQLQLASLHGVSEAGTAALRAAWPQRLRDGTSIAARALRRRSVVNVADLLAESDADYAPAMKEACRLAGFRSGLSVPMLRDQQLIGAITVNRAEPGLYADKEVALLQTFARQAVVAIENVRLFNETTEALEQQRASGDVLTAISSSISDAKPVFEVILASCQRLFAGHTVGVTLVRDDGMLDVGANAGPGFDELKKVFPQPLTRKTASGLAILDRKVMAYSDVDSGHMPVASRDGAHAIGNQSMAFAPMLFEGRGIGTLWVGRPVKGPFTDKQLTLLKTFADQAVIAIQNARLFNETKEALERQTATAEILRVISASVTDSQPVFDAIVGSCQSLFGGLAVNLMLAVGETLERVAVASAGAIGPSEGADRWPLDRESVSGECVLASRVVVVRDREEAFATYPRTRQLAAAQGWRSAMLVPLLREGQAIGCLGVLREEPSDFADKDVALAQTFADQAVIAIENARLFNETREALEQQSASAEVLSVISSSVSDTAPVFEKILDSCERLFGTDQLCIYTIGDDNIVRTAAWRGAVPSDAGYNETPLEQSITARVIRERKPFYLADVLGEANLPDPPRRRLERLGNISAVYAPMLWEERGIGSIVVMRQPPKPFSDKELTLLQTFADQAAIAIQNARLFNETKEALEQQTATAEVLNVISSSVADAAPVFDKILDSCQHLFATAQLGMFLVGEDGLLHTGAFRGELIEGVRHTFPRPLEDTTTGRAIRQRQPVYIADMLADADTAPASRAVAEHAGNYSAVFAPMLWEDSGIGSIGVLRQPPQPFSDKEINLLKTFADQAVIAIQNARLFNETKEALEQQTATAQVLQVISSSVADARPVFDEILLSCERLFESAEQGILLVDDDDRLHLGAHHGSAFPLLQQVFAGGVAVEQFGGAPVARPAPACARRFRRRRASLAEAHRRPPWRRFVLAAPRPAHA